MKLVDIAKTVRVGPTKDKDVPVVTFREDGFSTIYYADMEMLNDEDGATGISYNAMSDIEIPEEVAAVMREMLSQA